jgi:hypothetical protein
MDLCGYTLSRSSVVQTMIMLHANEQGIGEEDSPVPDKNTIRKYLTKLDIPIKTAREGPGVDALRESKATNKYLGDYFDKLEEVCQKFQIKAKNM